MRCSGCGAPIGDGARFCGSCGRQVARNCAECGAGNPIEAVSCQHCGAALPPGGTAAGEGLAGEGSGSERAPRGAPQLHSATMLEGERKDITVLFADIKGSTELIEGLDPEQALARLDTAISAMVAAVHRYDGVVNRVQGDGIMALFGAPLAHEEHAVRACYAALAIQSAMSNRAEGGLAVRVGIHSGEVVVRSIRNDLSLDYDAAGATVHVAARMEQLAPPGSIRITAATHALAREFIRVRSLGDAPIRGISRRLEQFELLGRNPVRMLWDARAARGLTPFVGRAPEIAALRTAAADAARFSGRVLFVVGEPGVGKSRLVHEFLRGLPAEGWAVMRGGATPFSSNTPYAAIRALLRGWLSGAEPETPAVLGERLDAALAGDPELAASRPAFASLLDLPIADEAWRGLEPASRRRQLLEALPTLALKLATRHPLAIVVEDMHWADSESLAAVLRLVERAREGRLLVIATHRPEFAVPISDAIARVTLEPLASEQAGELLGFLVGDDPALARLKQMLVQRTGGIPFFMEETSRALVETGALERGEARLGASAEELQIPQNVRALLAARIDRLPARQKALLQMASIIGAEITQPLLELVAEMPRGAVSAGLEELVAAGFLRRDDGAAEPGHAFVHMLTREVAYETLLQSRRRALHASLVHAMESRDGAAAGEPVDLLAYHAYHGAIWAKALKYLVRAAGKAVELSAYPEAAKLFEQALTALEHLPRERDLLVQAIDIRLALRGALGVGVDFERIAQRLAEAKEIAVEIDDRHRLAAITVAESVLHNMRGDLARSVATGTEAIALAEAIGTPGLAIVARIYLGQAQMWRGDVAAALAALGTDTTWTAGPLRHHRAGTTGTSAVLWFGQLAAIHAYMGEFAAAMRHAGEAVAIAEEVRRPYDLALARWYLAFTLYHRGRLAEAAAALEESHRLCTANDIRFLLPILGTSIGYVKACAGRHQEARQILARTVAANKAHALLYGEAWTSAHLAFACLLDGDLAEAKRLGTAALEIARAQQYRMVEVSALRLLGRCAASLPGPENTPGERECNLALDLSLSLGIRPETAHCHLDLAEVLRQAQRGAEAREEATRALALYHDMEMPFWTAKAEGLLAALS